MNERITAQIIRVLTLAETLGLPGRNVDIDSSEVIQAYVLVLVGQRIDEEILVAATPDILCERFFPSPGAIVERCLPHRRSIEEERQRNRMRGWRDALDPRGGTILAPPGDILDGHYVGRGLGNGVALEANDSLVDVDALRKVLSERRPPMLPASPDGTRPSEEELTEMARQTAFARARELEKKDPEAARRILAKLEANDAKG